MAAGLADGKVRKRDTVNCVGHLFPDQPEGGVAEASTPNRRRPRGPT